MHFPFLQEEIQELKRNALEKLSNLEKLFERLEGGKSDLPTKSLSFSLCLLFTYQIGFLALLASKFEFSCVIQYCSSDSYFVNLTHHSCLN